MKKKKTNILLAQFEVKNNITSEFNFYDKNKYFTDLVLGNNLHN